MTSVLFNAIPVIVRGGGDLASGVILRLTKAGFPVLVMELAQPLVIRRAVAFASAVFERSTSVEEVPARRIEHVDEVRSIWDDGAVPVIVDETGASIAALQPAVVVDARMIKRNPDTDLTDAPLVVALGPGYTAGKDCHAVIETNRGHFLGRVIWQGTAEADTGKPGGVQGRVADRVLRAPADGCVTACADIGSLLKQDDLVAEVGGAAVRAPFAGVLRGLIHSSVPVKAGLKIGDVDPRGIRAHCFTVSEKALAIGGGVLEAIFSAPQLAERLRSR